MSDEEKNYCKRHLTLEEKIETIRNVLEMMRVKLYEVPFIAVYRKENVTDYLPINDLWRIYAWDEKVSTRAAVIHLLQWCLLSARKEKLINMFKRMQAYQVAMAQLHASGATVTALIGFDTPLIVGHNIDVYVRARTYTSHVQHQ
jgi:hypothetical protein